jgi:ketosteroid isomerase-like protein
MLKEDESQIRALEDSFAAAFNSGSIDSIMKTYIPDQSFIIFDVVPRKEYRGADAYRKFWEEMFSHFTGVPKIEIVDLGITCDSNVGFGHSFQHVTGTDNRGESIDRWVRVTDGYRKIGGQWLIAMEHISVPVDFRTGRLVAITGP